MSLRDGRLRLHKPGDSIGVTYEHHQVLQLVKSRSKEQRLGIQLEGQNRNNYLFNSMQVYRGERGRERETNLCMCVREGMGAEKLYSRSDFFELKKFCSYARGLAY